MLFFLYQALYHFKYFHAYAKLGVHPAVFCQYMVLCLSLLLQHAARLGLQIFPQHLGSLCAAQTPAASRTERAHVASDNTGDNRCFFWLFKHFYGQHSVFSGVLWVSCGRFLISTRFRQFVSYLPFY